MPSPSTFDYIAFFDRYGPVITDILSVLGAAIVRVCFGPGKTKRESFTIALGGIVFGVLVLEFSRSLPALEKASLVLAIFAGMFAKEIFLFLRQSVPDVMGKFFSFMVQQQQRNADANAPQKPPPDATPPDSGADSGAQ